MVRTLNFKWNVEKHQRWVVIIIAYIIQIDTLFCANLSVHLHHYTTKTIKATHIPIHVVVRERERETIKSMTCQNYTEKMICFSLYPLLSTVLRAVWLIVLNYVRLLCMNHSTSEISCKWKFHWFTDIKRHKPKFRLFRSCQWCIAFSALCRRRHYEYFFRLDESNNHFSILICSLSHSLDMAMISLISFGAKMEVRLVKAQQRGDLPNNVYCGRALFFSHMHVYVGLACPKKLSLLFVLDFCGQC